MMAKMRMKVKFCNKPPAEWIELKIKVKLSGWNQSETKLETYVTDLYDFNSIVLKSERKMKTKNG